jgi:hypothetical protein
VKQQKKERMIASKKPADKRQLKKVGVKDVNRLTLQLEFEGGSVPDPFTGQHFRSAVDVSVRRVLGTAAPDYEV